MQKRPWAVKAIREQKYKIILVCVWAVILIICFLNKDKFTIDGIVEQTPKNAIFAAIFMLLLFALKSLSVFVFSGFLFIADGMLFPLPVAILVNIFGAAIMISLPYWIGKRVGKDMIDHIVKKYPKVEVLRKMRTDHEFILSFITRAVNVLPSDILSLYMGAVGISYQKYLIGSILGLLLPIITFPIMGTSITDPTSPAFLVSAGLQAAVSIISILSYWFFRRKRQERGA